MSDTATVHDAQRARPRSLVDGLAVLGVVVAPSLALAAERGNPLGLPRLLELALWSCFFAATGLEAYSATTRAAERGHLPLVRALAPLVSFALGLHVLFAFRVPAWLADESSAEVVSRASAQLSATWHGWPVCGLLYGWALAALAWTARTLVLASWPPLAKSAGAPGIIANATYVWTLAFGTLSLLGYATGSPWLVPE